MAPTQSQEPPLGLAAREGRLGTVAREQAQKPAPPRLPRKPREGPFDRSDVEGPASLGCVEHAPGLGICREVDDRAGHGSDRNALDDLAVLVVENPRPVHDYALPRSPAARHAHLDAGRGRAKQPVTACGRAVAEDRPRPARHHGGELARVGGEPAVSHGVDALVQANQIASRMAPRDAVRRQPEQKQLPARDYAVLTRSKLLDPPPDGVWAAFVPVCGRNVAHSGRRARVAEFTPEAGYS